MSQKYVTQGAILTCNQGIAPATLRVTSNFTIKSQNKLVATELDKAPFVNIPSFSGCRLIYPHPGPCIPSPIMWTDTHPTNKCCNAKTLLKKSSIPCAIGGKISITNTSQIIASTGAKVEGVKVEEIVDVVQTAFDLAGLIPVVGEFFDGLNAAIYTVRGDYTNAALSAAAMVPIAGWAATGGKIGGKAIKASKSSKKLVFPPGSFSIINWKGYPKNGVKPKGPFRLIDGDDYNKARKMANAHNFDLRKSNPTYFKGKQIHEIHPVKFGGSPIEGVNKIPLTPKQHAEFTKYWNNLMRNIK